MISALRNTCNNNRYLESSSNRKELLIALFESWVIITLILEITCRKWRTWRERVSRRQFYEMEVSPECESESCEIVSNKLNVWSAKFICILRKEGSKSNTASKRQTKGTMIFDLRPKIRCVYHTCHPSTSYWFDITAVCWEPEIIRGEISSKLYICVCVCVCVCIERETGHSLDRGHLLFLSMTFWASDVWPDPKIEENQH